MITLPNKVVMSAVVCLALGIYLLRGGLSYGMGTLSFPGPGFFPVVLGVVLMACGAALGVQAFGPHRSAGLSLPLRAYILFPAALVAFALLVGRTGLLPAVAVATLIATFARPDWRPIPTLLLIGGIGGLVWLLFLQLLGIPVAAFAWMPR